MGVVPLLSAFIEQDLRGSHCFARERETFLQQWGLKMASSKTRLWSPSEATGQELRKHDVLLPFSEGLLICGHTLTAEDSEVPFGAPAFTERWLAQKPSHESLLLQRLLRYGDALHDVPTWHLVHQLMQCFWPARLMHLMRSLPYDHFEPALEQIQEHLKAAYLHILQVDRMSPLQWKVAHLPPAHGGLGVPRLSSLSLCARSAALAALAHTEASEVASSWIQHEQDGLLDRLRGLTADEPTSILGNIEHLPAGRAVKPLQRHLSASIFLSELTDVKQSVHQDPILTWQWERHRTFATDRGHLLHMSTSWWMGSFPSTSHTWVSNTCFRWHLRTRMGFADPDAGQPCMGTSLQGTQSCGRILDRYGCHAGACPMGLGIKRHNAIRDYLARCARTAGLFALVEQQTTQEITTAMVTDEQPRPKRPKQRADLYLIDGSGGETWADVRSFIASFEKPLEEQLCKQESHKAAEYGERPVYTVLHGPLQPVVIEAAGRCGTIAGRFLQYLMAKRAAFIQLHQAESPHKAQRQAALELWPELGARLVRIAYEAHALATGRAAKAPYSDAPQSQADNEPVASSCHEAGSPWHESGPG